MPSLDNIRAAFDLLPDAVFCIDRQTMTFALANQAACASLGYTAQELLAAGPCHVCSQEDVAALAARLDGAAAGEQPPSAMIRTRQRRKDGLAVPVEWHVTAVRESGAEYWIVVARELSASGAAGGLVGEACLESRELGIPGHDPLTGLPDRRLFERRLDRALGRARQHDDYKFAVCFIDLDNFKEINDACGHLVGDRVLCEVARRLSGCVRPGDMVARYGGDEFTVLVDNLHGDGEAMLVARRILGQMEMPATIDGRSLKVALSIGVAVGSRDDRRIQDLLHAADRAMYGVKAMGGNNCQFSTDALVPGHVKPR